MIRRICSRWSVANSVRNREPSARGEAICAPVFPGDAADAAEAHGASDVARTEATQHGWRVLAILSMLMGFASISTDLYLPAMPMMEHELGTNSAMIEWTISGYLIGFSLGQLLWGPIGDRLGRKLPVAIGIILFIFGSAGCAMATTGWGMIAARLVQAAGACANVVLARAMVRDLYTGDRAAQMMSMLMSVMAIAPLIGPLVGGQILAMAGWRAIFWVLVGVGTLILAATITLPETLAPDRRNREPMRLVMVRYGQLLSNRRLLAFASAGGFYYGGMFAYLAGTPFAYIDYYHVAPQHYGFLFGLGIIGIMASNVVNARIVVKLSATRLLFLGTAIAAIAGIGVAVATATGWGGLWGLVISLFFFVSMAGFIAANSIAGALNQSDEHAGSISALVGAIHYGSGVIGSALVGAFIDGTPRPMGVVIAITGVGSVLCALRLNAKT